MPNSVRLGRYHLNLDFYVLAEEMTDGDRVTAIVMTHGVRLTFEGDDGGRLRLRLDELDGPPESRVPSTGSATQAGGPAGEVAPPGSVRPITDFHVHQRRPDAEGPESAEPGGRETGV